MKKFAFYLPQFHEIPENNLWWGDGFTEWTNVKKAKSLFKNHDQPKRPLNDFYYDLLDINTILWQTELMKEYKIDGFIYYHYYFNGKLLLEKPAENLLKNKDISQPFFFCWANHSWRKTWNGSKKMLIEQTYGNENDWEKHFQYLLPFFRDERYEKNDNRPLFMLYSYNDKQMRKMIDYFNKRCKEEGFSGLYTIRTYDFGYYDWPKHYKKIMNEKDDNIKRIFLREANTALDIYNSKFRYKIIKTIKRIKKEIYKLIDIKLPSIYSGDLLYDIILNNEDINDKLIHGLFFEWDNTPRHGYKGYIITPPSKEKFMKIMNHFRNEDYVFFNAWNEWAEGMMLEPTKKEKYKYLEWIKEWCENNEK